MANLNVTGSSAFQYTFVLINCLVLSLMAAFMERKRRSRWSETARRIYMCVCALANECPVQSAIEAWKQNKAAELYVKRRRVLYWLAHIPLLIGASAPAILYVLARKFSHPSELH